MLKMVGPPWLAPAIPSGLRRFVSWLSWFSNGFAGPRSISGESKARIVQPLLFILLLILLVLQGCRSSYLDAANGATFGVGGFYDNLPLFLRGLGVDVAQRTLQQPGGRTA